MKLDKTSYKSFIIKNILSFSITILTFSILLNSGKADNFFYNTNINVINAPFSNGNVIGKNDITIQQKKEEKEINSDFESIKSKYYTVDKRTEIFPSDIDINKFINTNMIIDNSIEGPKILIFHTHSGENYSDSDGSFEDGIWGVGEVLKNHLENMLGIEVLHDTGRYDLVNGKGQVLGAYERMEPSIQKILKENPSIQMVIDLHRDGIAENVKLVTEIDGKQCAKIMFFNGICRLTENRKTSLNNPYIQDNLALSFKLQTAAEQFENFTRKIYINAYRYSLHFKPMSLLIEVGAQTNTKEEAKNSMYYLAKIISETIQIK